MTNYKKLIKWTKVQMKTCSVDKKGFYKETLKELIRKDKQGREGQVRCERDRVRETGRY